jgi:predicted DNA-binding protein (UPF0251 family)
VPLDQEARRRGGVKSAAKRNAQLKDMNERRDIRGQIAALAANKRGLQIGEKVAPPANVFEVLRAVGAKGATKTEAAQVFGINVRTLNRWLDEYPEVQEAWEEAKTLEHDMLVNKLFSLAMEGNVIAILFALKARFAYVEGAAATTQNNVSITFNLPGAKTPEQYRATIDAVHSGSDEVKALE